METVRHAMRQLNSCEWLVFNVLRIKNKEIAAPLFMAVDHCQQKPFAFRRLRRTRHENRFRRKALGAKVVQLPSAGLVVIAEDGVKEACIDRCTRPSTSVTVAITQASVAFIQTREFGGTLVELLFFYTSG